MTLSRTHALSSYLSHRENECPMTHGCPTSNHKLAELPWKLMDMTGARCVPCKSIALSLTSKTCNCPHRLRPTDIVKIVSKYFFLGPLLFETLYNVILSLFYKVICKYITVYCI